MPNGTFDDERDEVVEQRRRTLVESDLEQFAKLAPALGRGAGFEMPREVALAVGVVPLGDSNQPSGGFTTDNDHQDALSLSPTDSDAPASVFGVVQAGMFQRPGESHAEFTARLKRETEQVNRASVGS